MHLVKTFLRPHVSGSRMELRFAILAGALFLHAPTAFAQPAAGDGFRGQGAAVCIAAGEILAAQPGADAGIRDGVSAWRQVLHVMDATEDRRKAALDSARASLARTDERGTGMATTAARVFWTTACAERDMLVRYIAVHGSEERARDNLAEEPGTEMAAEAMQRLKVSATCLVAAELFAQPGPSRTLRAALQGASPRLPDAGVLQAIRERSRQEIDGAPGSAAGKALVVDYLRYLYNGASGGRDPQPFVNRTSQLLQDRCQPGTGSRQPAP
jgi:hypothetical protein